MFVDICEHNNWKIITFNTGNSTPKDYFILMNKWLEQYTYSDNIVMLVDCRNVNFSKVPLHLLKDLYYFMSSNNKVIGKKITGVAILSSPELLFKFNLFYTFLYTPKYPNLVSTSKEEAVSFLQERQKTKNN